MENVKQKWFLNQVTHAFKKTDIKKINLSPLDRLVLYSLSEFADKKGVCFPETSDIESLTGIDKDNLSRYFKKLVALKIITIIRKYCTYKGKPMTKNSYQIHIDVILNITANAKGEIKIENIDKKISISDQGTNIEPTLTVKDGSKSDKPHENLYATEEKHQCSNIEPTLTVRGYKPTQLKAYPKELLYNVQTDENLTNVVSLPVDAHFENFWAHYPRKEKKEGARKIWIRENLDRLADQIIHDLVDRQARHDRWESRKFIPLATTYLNQQGWTDEIIDRKEHGEKDNGKSKQGSFGNYMEQLAEASRQLHSGNVIRKR